MTAAVGGRWIFSVFGQPVVLGINDGVHPIFPAPQTGAFNIEVFTNTTVTAIPNPLHDGFQDGAIDAGAVLDNGFLTGPDLRLGTGNFLVVDSVTGAFGQSPAKVTLGSGNQTVIGAKGDTLIGGSGNQILSAIAGNQRVIGGNGDESIWGGGNDTISVNPVGNLQLVLGAGTSVDGGNSSVAARGSAVIAATAQDTVTWNSSENVVIAAGTNNWITFGFSSGSAAVIGGFGDTIFAGRSTNIDGSAGGMLIFGPAPEFGGTLNVTGSTSPVAGDTINGSTGALTFNPGSVAGKGDLIDIEGGGLLPIGPSTINAFSFGSTRITAPDTIMGGGNVFAGAGDRVGTSRAGEVGPGGQWIHADTVAGSAVGFGSNSTVVSANYNTVGGTVTRDPLHGGNVSVGGFNTTTDFIFYQNEASETTSAIIATSQSTTVNGIQSTIIVLPDSTAMTLIGIVQAQLTPALFKP